MPNPTNQWLCIHLHRLSLDVVVRGLEDTRNVAVCASRASSRWVYDCDDGLFKRGVKPNMALASAYALAPEMQAYPRHLMAESDALKQTAFWCYGISSQVCIFPPDMVLAEVGGSLKLLGPVENIASKVRHGLKRLGFRAQLAAAPAAAAARLLARAGRYGSIRRLDPVPESLQTVPLSAAELPEKDIQSLSRMGVATLRELLALPRDGLKRRFGQSLLNYFDRVLGLEPEALKTYRPAQTFQSTIELPCEVENQEALLFPIQRLLTALCDFLVTRDLTLDRFDIVLGHPHGDHSMVKMGMLEPGRNEHQILELIRERLHHFELPAPVREITLTARHLFSFKTQTQDLFETRARSLEKLPRLVERLCSRLGEESVFTLTEKADHRPEKAWLACPLKGAGKRKKEPPRQLATRPLWLLDQPESLTRPPQKLISGPERIESGWWDNQDASRDYYIAEARPGEQLWVYRDRRRDRWYLQGVFS